MKFWTKDRLKTAIVDCEIYNMPEDWTSSGLRIWHEDFDSDYIALMRGENEIRGILPKYLPTILEKASAIMTTKAELFKEYNKPIIELQTNPSDVIINMAKYIRSFFSGKVIAITGSSGKSTTTKILYDVLEQYGVDSNLGRANTSWGISWNMTCFDIDKRYWAIETSLGGGIARNSQITKPHYAVVTNIAPVHLKENQDITIIAKEKSKIFDAMETDQFAILYKQMNCFDIVYQAAIEKGLKVITYGEFDSDINVKFENEHSFECFGNKYYLKDVNLSKHIMLDMAVTVAIAHLEDLDMQQVLEILKQFKPLEGRGETFEGKISADKFVTVVDESYNANPLSMQESLRGFKKLIGDKNSILILGDMSEGGANSIEQHIALQEVINEVKPSRILFCGKDIKRLWEILKFVYPGAYYESVELLNKEVTSWLKDEDYVFIKSSHSTQLFRTVNVLKAYIKKYNCPN